jgi:hypothetical protein
MGPQGITSTNSSRSAISTTTAYATKISKEAEAAKAAAAIQKTAADIATLQSANKSLEQSKKELKTANGVREPKSLYYKGLILDGKWGSNATLNSAIPGVHVVGSTLTGADILAINTTIAGLDKYITENNAKITALDTKIKANKALIDAKSKSTVVPVPQAKPKTDPNAQSTVSKAPPEWPTPDYQWNLPPHAWSLPTDPADVNPGFNNKRSDSVHTTRRGRIWYYQGYVGPNNVQDYTTGTYKVDAAGNTVVSTATLNQSKYGFQFIWNPETFSQQTAVNMSVTPSNTDPTIGLTGFAAANSTMQFTLRLDRTNDFACAKSHFIGSQGSYSKTVDELTSLNSLGDVAQYYRLGNFSSNSVELFDTKIHELLKYGTEADLEYLYKTVNGDGWKGIGGRDTSNIGYLMPALIRVDLGNQKFVGVVSSVSVQHLAFTQDMVPIRSDVNLTIDLRANIQPTTNAGTQ